MGIVAPEAYLRPSQTSIIELYVKKKCQNQPSRGALRKIRSENI